MLLLGKNRLILSAGYWVVRKQKKKEKTSKTTFFLVLIWWKVCIANVPFLCPDKNDLFGALRQFLDGNDTNVYQLLIPAQFFEFGLSNRSGKGGIIFEGIFNLVSSSKVFYQITVSQLSNIKEKVEGQWFGSIFGGWDKLKIPFEINPPLSTNRDHVWRLRQILL